MSRGGGWGGGYGGDTGRGAVSQPIERVDYTGPFLSCKGQLFVFTSTDSLPVDLPSLSTMLLPKPISMKLHNASTLIFHTALLLTKKVILQQIK